MSESGRGEGRGRPSSGLRKIILASWCQTERVTEDCRGPPVVVTSASVDAGSNKSVNGN